MKTKRWSNNHGSMTLFLRTAGRDLRGIEIFDNQRSFVKVDFAFAKVYTAPTSTTSTYT